MFSEHKNDNFVDKDVRLMSSDYSLFNTLFAMRVENSHL